MSRLLYTDNASAVECVLQPRDLLLVLIFVVSQRLDATSQHADLRLKVTQLAVLLVDLLSNVSRSLRRLLQPNTPSPPQTPNYRHFLYYCKLNN